MNIIGSNYDHKALKSSFYNDLKESINYLREFADMEPIECFPLKWNTSAAHYLAIKAAEQGNIDRLKFYLNYISSQKEHNEISIHPLFDDGELESSMILEIIEDDNQIGFGFCEDKDNDLINQEKDKINKAILEIKKYDICSYDEISEYIDSIYLTKEGKDGERFMRSGTNFYMWGLMFIYINGSHSIPYYIDHIIHECGHTALNILNGKDELVTNSHNERFSAPLRKDKRPMIGLFHALFVLNRICSTFKNIIGDDNCLYLQEAKDKYQQGLIKLQETYTTVRKNAKTTKLGEEILNEIKLKWNLE